MAHVSFVIYYRTLRPSGALPEHCWLHCSVLGFSEFSICRALISFTDPIRRYGINVSTNLKLFTDGRDLHRQSTGRFHVLTHSSRFTAISARRMCLPHGHLGLITVIGSFHFLHALALITDCRSSRCIAQQVMRGTVGNPDHGRKTIKIKPLSYLCVRCSNFMYRRLVVGHDLAHMVGL